MRSSGLVWRVAGEAVCLDRLDHLDHRVILGLKAYRVLACLGRLDQPESVRRVLLGQPEPQEQPEHRGQPDRPDPRVLLEQAENQLESKANSSSTTKMESLEQLLAPLLQLRVTSTAVSSLGLVQRSLRGTKRA